MPIGRFGSFSAARERRRALAITEVASCCPTTCLRKYCSNSRSFLFSPSSILASGMPVHEDTTAIMSSSPTSTTLSSSDFFHAFTISSFCETRDFSVSRKAAAASKRWSRMASSFCCRTEFIFSVSSFTSAGRSISLIRALLPASSMTSIALSGRNLLVM